MSPSTTPQPAPARSPQSQSKLPDINGSDDGASSSGSSDESEPVETLIAGRARRATAGNRMSHLIGQEEEGGEDDDVALLFAETGGEDIDFEDPDAQQKSGDGEDLEDDEEDDDDDSDSSTDEDKGPDEAGGELEGEQQLQKEERAAKKAQKRKAMAKPLAVRKRVKIDDSAAAKADNDEGAAARPRKKSERVSWLPTGDDAPIRTSSRTLSVQNKQRTMASMKESDARRAQTIKNMEVASQKKKQERAKQMTQEERLEEAARVEEINTKSLTRWEEMEKERLEKQRAKIAALQNRTLEGPVIRWYTGPAEKVGGKVTMLGDQSVVKEIITSQHDLDAPKERKYQRKNKKPKEPPADSTNTLEDNMPNTETTAAVAQPDAGTASGVPTAPPADATVAKDPPTELQDESTAIEINTSDVQALPADDKKVTDGSTEELKSQTHNGNDLAEHEIQPKDDWSGDKMDVDSSTVKNVDPPELSPSREQITETEDQEDSEQPANEVKLKEDNDAPLVTANDAQTTNMEIDGADETRGQLSDSQSKPLSPASNSQQVPTGKDTGQLPQPESEPKVSDGGELETTSELPAILSKVQTPAESQPQVELTAQPHLEDATTPLEAPLPPPEPVKTSQQTVTLLEFSENALNSLDASRRILFSPPPSLSLDAPAPLPIDAFIRPPKPVPQTCVITGTSARYRDPATGLPYSDRTAYAMIKRVLRGECRWSNLLGAWVGADVEQIEGVEKDVSNGQDVALVGIGGTRAARGVPLGFLDPASVLPPPPPAPTSGSGEKSVGTASQGAEVKVEGGNAASTAAVPAAATAAV